MNVPFVAGLIFVGVFAGVVLIHELGHFLASRLFKVDVEEFGIGLPPRALRFWRAKGSLVVNGQKIEIPRNFDLPFDGREGQDLFVKATANQVDERLMLSSIEFEEQVIPEPDRRRYPEKEIRVDQEGNVVDPEQPEPKMVRRVVGKPGPVEISGRISELHLGTEFTLNWLPLGGFVRPKGENDPNIPGGLAAANPWVRLGVLFAGPLMNLIAGVLVNSMLFMQVGVPDMSQVVLYEISPNSPAEQAGLMADDLVLAVDGEPVNGDDDFRASIREHLDRPMTITVQRGDETLELTATPSSSRPAEEGALGLLPGPVMVQPDSWFQTVPYGASYTYQQIHQILSLPAMMIRGSLSPEEGRFVGLKGIYDLFGEAVSRDVQTREPATTATPPTNYTIQLIAFLTVTLGVFNLLPFPALDGGRIIFVLPEIVLRKRVPPQLENVVHAVGFTLLILFMIYVNVMDFINPINVTLP